MPKSKTNKDRKDKLLKYKNSKKMSKTPEIRPFRQVPTWQSTEKFEIQGNELEALYSFFNIFAPAFTAVQQVFARGVQDEKIKIGYEYEDGTQVPDSDIKAYTEKLNKYFEEQVKEREASESAEKSTAKIVDFAGTPLTKEEVERPVQIES